MPESYSTQLVPPAAEAAMTAAAEGAKNIDRLAPLLIVLWILLGISTITFALRFYAKRRTRKLSWDDSFMLVALAIAWLYTLFLDRAHHYGLGRHSKFLSDINFILCHKWITLSEGCGILAPTFGRMSFSVYLLGLIGYASIRLRWALIACIVSQFVTNGITTALVYLQCGTHVAAIWDPRVPANCLDPSLQNKWGYFHSGWNSLTDLFLFIVPAWIIWTLTLQMKKKVVLLLLLGLSLLAFVATLIKTYWLRVLGSINDPTWVFCDLVTWIMLETHTVIIGASIPIIKQLFSKAPPSEPPTHVMVLPSWVHHELRPHAQPPNAMVSIQGIAASGNGATRPHGKVSFSRGVDKDLINLELDKTPSRRSSNNLVRSSTSTSITKTVAVSVTSTAELFDPNEFAVPYGINDHRSSISQATGRPSVSAPSGESRLSVSQPLRAARPSVSHLSIHSRH